MGGKWGPFDGEGDKFVELLNRVLMDEVDSRFKEQLSRMSQQEGARSLWSSWVGQESFKVSAK